MTDHLASWLRRRTINAEAERQIAKIIMETGGQTPTHPNSHVLPGDPWKLRGIPVVGVHGGIGGAIPGTKPHTIR